MQTYQRILTPVDGSPFSDAAVEHTVAIAQAMGSSVVFLFVMDTLRAYREGVVNTEEARQQLGARGAVVLESARATAANAQLYADGELEEGEPVEVIVRRAADFDLVVMGSHGMGLWKRLTMGSVSLGVLQRVSRPVLVVRREPTGVAP